MLKKSLILAFILAAFLLFQPKDALAIENPLSSPNNSFGIHIVDPHDLDDAAKLVNSSGGKWGYVTFVIQKTERDNRTWQPFFDKARRLKLIPIVRIATRQINGGWEKPSVDEIDGWVSFLNSINWVTKNRYVIVGNEPNHAKEWGNELNPKEYAAYLKTLSQKLKANSDEFFILPAGFDASAPDSKETMDEINFIRQMKNAEPDIFDHIDGWTSHSYPNPGFSGSPNARGRGTLTTFDWELSRLKEMGILKDLPVFITETGWAHNMSGQVQGLTNTQDMSPQLKAAFEEVWKDPRIVAVTPFLLNYQEKPFDVFSWKDKNGSFYDFYYELQKLPKAEGKPIQVTSGRVFSLLTPPVVTSRAPFIGVALVENTGQTIWEEKENFTIRNGQYEKLEFLSALEPGQKGIMLFSAQAPKQFGPFTENYNLLYQNEPILDFSLLAYVFF